MLAAAQEEGLELPAPETDEGLEVLLPAEGADAALTETVDAEAAEDGAVFTAPEEPLLVEEAEEIVRRDIEG